MPNLSTAGEEFVSIQTVNLGLNASPKRKRGDTIKFLAYASGYQMQTPEWACTIGRKGSLLEAAVSASSWETLAQARQARLGPIQFAVGLTGRSLLFDELRE